MTESRHRVRREPRTGFVYPSLLVAVAVAMGLVWYSPRGVRWGAAIVGAVMLLAALIRLVLPASAAGMFATRQRYTDAATLVVLGLGTLVVGLLVPPPT
jgi:uncharacterized membrane protein YbjE (DUF340 family)